MDGDEATLAMLTALAISGPDSEGGTLSRDRHTMASSDDVGGKGNPRLKYRTGGR